jgi:hypothetical protein
MSSILNLPHRSEGSQIRLAESVLEMGASQQEIAAPTILPLVA